MLKSMPSLSASSFFKISLKKSPVLVNAFSRANIVGSLSFSKYASWNRSNRSPPAVPSEKLSGPLS